MAVVLSAAAIVLLVLAAVIGPNDPSPWLRGVYLLSLWAGPALVLVAVGTAHASRLRNWLRATLRGVAGPSVIRLLPPRTVLSAVLKPVYGDRAPDEELLTALLGGAGRDPRRTDTAVSRSTSAKFRLEAIDDTTCLNEVTWTHDYSAIRENYKFIVFATSDASLAGTLVSERRLPLFELWVLDEDLLEDFVPTLRETTRFGITFTDTSGDLHVVEPTAMQGQEIRVSEFTQFVRLPARADRGSLRIVSFDLFDLVEDHVIDSIRTMSVRTMVKSSIDQRYATWSPPHPCFVEQVTFDVTGLPREGQKLSYLVLTATVAKAGLTLSGSWQEGAETITVDVRSWMLPGHAVTLVWRPREEG